VSPARRSRQVVADVGTLGDAVRARRNKLGMSQQEVASLAGTGRRFVSDLERGKETARLSNALRVLSALDLHLELPAAD
jgi:HTH-type transcriptional regulator/antitoxin HipB